MGHSAGLDELGDVVHVGVSAFLGKHDRAAGAQ